MKRSIRSCARARGTRHEEEQAPQQQQQQQRVREREEPTDHRREQRVPVREKCRGGSHQEGDGDGVEDAQEEGHLVLELDVARVVLEAAQQLL